MGQIEFIIALVVFVVTIVGAVLYLRADGRANRREWKADLEVFRQEWKADLEAFRQEWRTESEANLQQWRGESESHRQEWKADLDASRQEWKAVLEAFRQEWKADIATVVASVNVLRDAVVRLDQRLTSLEAKVDVLADKLETKAEEATVQRNHRELLIRLAFHHHGDGRYPMAAATDPDPVDPAAE